MDSRSSRRLSANADTNPMILIEAGYFGCPSVSTRMCGIPEVIEDGVTGLLLDFPASVDSLADAMERVIIDDEAYRFMRQGVRARMLRLFSRKVFENRVRRYISEVLPRDRL